MQENESNCFCRILESVQKVAIDSDGEFKYILMKLTCMNRKHELPSVTIVRGYKRHNNHTDIFNEVRYVENKALLQQILHFLEI